MSFIEVALDENVKELSAVPDGNYDLAILDFSDKESKKGSAMLTIIHEILGQPDAMPVKQWITLPTKGDDSEAIRQKSLGLKRYLTMAGIEYTEAGFDTDDLVGTSFSGKLVNEMVEEDKDGNPLEKPYPTNRLIVPFLDSEE